jgi:NADH-quinone oxidoreductase subunit N
MSYLELLRIGAPETIMVVTVLAVLAADLVALRELEPRFRRLITAMLGCVGCAVATGWMLALPQSGDFMAGMMVVNPLTQCLKGALLVLTIMTLLLSVDSDFTTHPGEYVALVLLAAVGMMFLVSARDILMIFVSLELTSLSLYILTAFSQRSPASAEAGLKYFLFGGLAAAFTLFGLSLLYGLSGATGLSQIAAAIHGPRLDPLLLLALVLTLAGFGFKVAVAPFHLWAPDTYQGAPAPSAAFIASGSKVAGFFVLAQVMLLGFKGAEGRGDWGAFLPGWMPALAVMAAVSMVLGNLAAIVQTSVRRLLAYSAIAHGGYLLLGVMAAGTAGTASLLYYVLTYALSALGAFGVVAVVQDRAGGERLADFAGLSRRAPVVSFCMMVFMLSLAGIPPLAGFFGKFYVFSAALRAGANPLGLLWLVVLALATSAVSLYYYLQVLKQIYVAPAPAGAVPFKVPLLMLAVVVLLALAVVVLGCCPDLLLAPIGADPPYAPQASA